MLTYIVPAVVILLVFLGLLLHNLLTTGKPEPVKTMLERNLTGVPRDEWHDES